MLTNIEGIIKRRVLLNYRADPDAVNRLIPRPLEAVTCNGAAVIGICLIQLQDLRPAGIAFVPGLNSENMAHRVAVRYRGETGWCNGVFIWRRESDCRLVRLLGGRLFPGVHELAEFSVREVNDELQMDVRTRLREADVTLRVRRAERWTPSALFQSAADAQEFVRHGDAGFSYAQSGRRLEGMRLRMLNWNVAPLEVTHLHSAFYAAPAFAAARPEFDSAFVMENVEHEWHSLASVPELAGNVASDLVD